MCPAANLPDRLKAHLSDNPGLLPAGSRVLVALSGGPDSMALLDLLCALRGRLGVRLCAAHFDHGLRPGSSAEALSVAEWASELGVPCRIGSATRIEPTGAEAPAFGPERVTQASLRDLRYAFLEAEAARTASDRLATAHHADDQAETVLFRLLRGTGLRGLAGIPARRGRIVRPLLPFRRAEIEQYVEARKIPCVRDPSNDDPRWSRVRVRRIALPALERAWTGGGALRLRELAGAAAAADRAIDELAWRLFLGARRESGGDRLPAAWTFDAQDLASHDAELLARGLRCLARRRGVRLSAGGTEAGVQFIKMGRSGTEIDLGGGMRMWREFACVSVGIPAAPEADQPLAVPSRKSGSGSLLLGGRRYEARWTTGVTGDRGRWSVAVPDARLAFPLDLRARRPGDRIRLAAGSRSLKRLFNDLRVPRGARASVPVLACGDTVLWACGLAAAHGLRTSPDDGCADSALRVTITPSAAQPSGGPRLAKMRESGEAAGAEAFRA